MLDFYFLITYLSKETMLRMINKHKAVPSEILSILKKYLHQEGKVNLGNHKFANEGGEK